MSAPEKQRLTLEERGDVTIAGFIDERILEQSDIEVIGNQLYKLVDDDGRRKLILNFSCVEFMSSAMLGKIAVLQRKMNSARGILRLCHLSPEIYPFFRITKLDRVLSIHSRLDDALKRF